MLKPELRKFYLAKQKSLSAEERINLSQKIADNFFSSFSFESIRNLHIFIPIEQNSEIATNLIYEKIWREFPQIQTFVPRLCVENLEHLQFTANTQLAKNSWQISEPIGDEIFVETTFDMVVVPLLCADEKGFRVGYGKGFYDKFLSKGRKDCLKIGVSYFEPIEKISDVNEFDVKLDFIVSPKGTKKFFKLNERKY
jgi:5-formyltetrahydrofolate cyclo-ligase